MRTLVICIGIALLRPALAQEGPKKTAVVMGRVENAKTNEPLRKVNVSLRTMGAAGTGMAMMTPGNPHTAVTDAEGKYRIENVEPGNYQLSAEKQGFVRRTYGSRGLMAPGTTLKIAAGAEMGGMDFKMMPQGVVTGRVLDDEGEPLARVQVQVLRRVYSQGKMRLMPTGGGMTLDTGEFRLADLAPGTYWLNAMPMVTPVTGGEMLVPTYYPSAADDMSAQQVIVDAGQQVTGMDIRLRKVKVYKVRGKVSGAVAGEPSVRLLLAPKSTGGMMGVFGNHSVIAQKDGTFEIGGAPSGSYFVMALPAQGMMRTLGQTAVEIGREDVEGVTVSVATGGTVRGSVRVDGGVKEQKVNLSRVRVQLMPADGVGFNVPGAGVKEDGTFVVENAGAGRYRVTAFNLPENTWLRAVRAGDVDVAEQPIDLSTGAELDVVLGWGVGKVAGKVKGGGTVTLMPEPMAEGRQDRLRIASTDASGAFLLENVAPGEYRIYAWQDMESNQFMDPEFVRAHEGNGKKVTVKADGQAEVELEPIPPGPVR